MIARLGCIMLLLFSFATHAQFPVSPNKIDENGKRTGFWTLLLDSTFQKEVKAVDSVRYYRLLRYENGLPVGKVRDFFRTGQKQWEGTLLSMFPDMIDGEAISYHENGKVKYRTNYKNGKPHGKHQEYSVNGKLISEGWMDNDLPVGTWNYYDEEGFRYLETKTLGNEKDLVIEYHRNGAVSRQGSRYQYLKEGLWISYYENGTILSKSHYRKDLKNGIWEWYNRGGVLEEKGEYLQDNKFGWWEVWYDGAAAKMKEGAYDSAGKETGKWTYYFENGKVKSEGEMVNGSNEGIWKFYHQNGALDIIGPLHKGYYHGQRKRYRDNGTLQEIVDYARDTIHGKFVSYFENGNVQAEGEKVWDKKVGVWKYYFESGALDGIETFKSGAIEGAVINYYPDGKIKDQTRYRDGKMDSVFVAYFPNGKIERTGLVVNGLKQGYWHWYFDNGQIDSKYFYKDNLYEGPFITYYPNGNVRTTAEGLHGQLHGWTVRRYAHGKLKEEGLNLNGLGTGKWKSYDSVTGKVKSRWSYQKGKFHGKVQYYTPEGKKSKYEYYINGWLEGPYNIRDSVYKLVRSKEKAYLPLAMEAVSWAKRVIKRDYSKNDKANAIPTYLQAYILQYGSGDYKSALPLQQEYLALVEKYEGKDAENYRVALNDVANIYSKLDRNEEALVIYDTLIAIAKAKNLVESYSIYFYNKATTLHTMNRDADAIELFEKEIQLHESTYGKNHKNTWAVKNMLADYHYSWKYDYPEAMKVYKSLLKEVVSTDAENDLLLLLYQRLGYCNNALGNRLESAQWLKKTTALSEKKSFPKPIEYLGDLSLLANLYMNIPSMDSAQWVQDKMGKFLTEHNLLNTIHQADLMDSKGEWFYNKSNYAEAIKWWEASALLLEKLNLTGVSMYSEVLRSLGVAYKNAGQFSKGLEFYEKGVAMSKEVNGEYARTHVQSEIILAGLYNSSSQYEKATALLQLVLQKVGPTPTPVQSRNYTDALNGLADVKRNLNDYREAIRLNELALPYLESNKHNEPEAYADALRDISTDYRRFLQYEESEKYILKALTVTEEAFGKESEDYLRMRTSLANYYDDRQLYSDAEKIYLEVLAGFERLFGKNSAESIYCLRMLSTCYYNQNEYAKAESSFNRYLTLAERVNGQLSFSYLEGLEQLAMIHYYTQNYEQSEKLHVQLMELGKQYYGDNSPDFAYYLKMLAEFYYNLNDLGKAENYSIAASALIAASDFGTNSPIYSRYLLLQARIFFGRDKNKEAEELFRKCLAITSANKEGYYADYIQALEGAATFYENLGQNSTAEKFLKEVIQLTEAYQGKNFNYASKSINLLGLYYSTKKYDEAIQLGEELLNYFEGELARTHYLILNIHNMMGLTEIDRRNFDKAAEHFQYNIEMRKLTQTENTLAFATYLNNLSVTTLAKGDFATTETLLNQSDNIRTQLGVKLRGREFAVVRDNFASLYQAWGKLDKAEKYWMEVTQTLLQHARQNFYFMSDEEKAQFWNDIKEDFEFFNTFAVLRAKQNPSIIGEMYNNQLETKAILLSASNKIKKRILTSGDQSMINHYYDWVEARERLAQLYSASEAEAKNKRSMIDSLELSARNLEKELNITAEDLNQDKGNQGKVTTWKDIQRVLAPHEAAVEIIRFRYFDRYLRDSVLYAALVITSETKLNPKWVVLPNGNFLETRAIRYYKNAVLAKLDDNLSYQNYWSAIDPLLAGKTRIYLSLDGVYNQLNLNTLADADGKFLVEDKNLTILSNTKDLLLLKSKKANRVQLTTASLFGYPKYFIGRERVKSKLANQKRDVDFDALDDQDATGIAELPGTQTEIAQVKNILISNRWQTKDYTDDEATEKALKSVEYPRVLHIATHGFFIDGQEGGAGANLGMDSDYARQNPLLRSGLLLSGAANFIQNNFRLEEENGILTAYEAANLNLDNTDLVVLSACETGTGEVQNGEGVYGLQRAFQTAGAQAIIMSLWKVDDAATQELMTAFYQNWMSGKMKAEAFRQAQLQLKNKYNHPYYWGAFVMMGN